ncbi:GNAT family N-acetyltransferase [Streptomyces sp. NPDC005438]|uniref:GNAT family N-acetyltransferase n=1 Tax=Streptomyces sp. NPDC005438 TaxID=3156880 RepID=UPI0033A92BD2
MPLTLSPLTADTYQDVLRLHVAEDQRGYVSPNVRSLADAWARPTARPMGLWEDGTAVGFALLDDAPERPGTLDLVRYMIDEGRQGRGLGRAGLAAVVDLARQEGFARVRLSVVPGNTTADHLYGSVGFRATGEVDDGETVMVLDLDGSA